ncbi:Glycosyltransferase involved in cell wall bisynthesis [Propionibacterium cyclohexanicum]|uniref:Glycosyltransferase involved in cell wall bisynthesis n=1 Tax=Propionibacterium cyclohexanicum TaxID=64702 RepID=A0A1H9RZJ5_9ACTN|nr:glycosyltransferase family 4 protein [Propionibacterium cyclohexanicum]SER77795.1 Glycosyltransferase involved in cell wall bisynthesis [Propionibacterium cyclohexanicum]
MSLTMTPDAPAAARPQEDPLKIGMIAPPWFELPPKGYGGTEAVVAALVDQLVARGHEVTLIASGAPGTKAQHYVRVHDEPPSELLGSSVMPELVLAAEAGRALRELDLDVVHDNSAAGPLLAAGRHEPTVVTMHGPVSGDNGDYYRRLGTSIELVAISRAQMRQAPGLNWAGCVPNGIDVKSFPFRAHKEDWVLWIGRFCADKAPHLAIEAARRAGRPIVLAGKLSEPPEKEYFDQYVRPMLGPDVHYVGVADAALKRELYSKAACLVFPIQWEEPFGMVMAEALACGTPVVATPRGSVPEIVRDGTTGFIARGIDAFAQAINRVEEIDPAACRRDAEQRFDLPVMAAGYERVYRMLVAGRRTIATLPVTTTSAAA